MKTASPGLPKTKGHWLFKSSLDAIRDPMGFIEKWHHQLGDMYEISTVTHPVVIVTDPEVVRHILQENHRNYHKSFDYEILSLALGQGLLTNEGESWLRQRRLAQPAFHRQRLASLYEVMAEETRQLVERWEGFAKTGETVVLAQEMMQVTMRIVGRALFGIDVGKDSEKIGEHLTLVNEHLSARAVNPFLAPDKVPTPRNIRFHRSLRFLDEAIYRIIRSRRPGDGRDDLLSMLMAARDEDTGEGMSERQLRDEVMTLFIAGHETSANALAWAFWELMNHPDAVDQLRAEVQQVCGDQMPTAQQLTQLPFADQLLQESMRLHPPAYVVGRRNYHPDVLGGYPIAKESNIIIATFLIHRDPRWWIHPDRFHPAHFDPERMKAQPKFTYFPFGSGPRMCIGNHFAMQEMQLLLAVLSSRFEMEPLSKEPVQNEPLVTLRPMGGIPVRIRKRGT
jgi:cytochrome P450